MKNMIEMQKMMMDNLNYLNQNMNNNIEMNNITLQKQQD